MLKRVRVGGTHFCDKTDTSEEDSMILLVEQLACGGYKDFHQVWHLPHNTCCTQSSLRERERGREEEGVDEGVKERKLIT